MPAPHPFETQLSSAWPASHWRDVTVLVAVSGGADSVALLRGLLAIEPQSNRRLVVAHFNHGLRGAESDSDNDFVVDLCRLHAVRSEIGRARLKCQAERSGDVSEAASREARYAFLRQTAAAVGARWIATGHTADDQVETILHRIVRGTGLAGLAGIPRVRAISRDVSLVRPLLQVSRALIRDYLAVIGQHFREDMSNRDVGFTRNRIRHELLPQLRRSYNQRVDDSLLRLGILSDEAQQVINDLVSQLLRNTVQYLSGTQVVVDCRSLLEQPPLLRRELAIAIWKELEWPLRSMSFSHWQELADLMQADCAQCQVNLPGQVTATKQGDQLVLHRP